MRFWIKALHFASADDTTYKASSRPPRNSSSPSEKNSRNIASFVITGINGVYLRSPLVPADDEPHVASKVWLWPSSAEKENKTSGDFDFAWTTEGELTSLDKVAIWVRNQSGQSWSPQKRNFMFAKLSPKTKSAEQCWWRFHTMQSICKATETKRREWQREIGTRHLCMCRRSDLLLVSHLKYMLLSGTSDRAVNLCCNSVFACLSDAYCSLFRWDPF